MAEWIRRWPCKQNIIKVTGSNLLWSTIICGIDEIALSN
jgi:hypothetical protein